MVLLREVQHSRLLQRSGKGDVGACKSAGWLVYEREIFVGDFLTGTVVYHPVIATPAHPEHIYHIAVSIRYVDQACRPPIGSYVFVYRATVNYGQTSQIATDEEIGLAAPIRQLLTVVYEYRIVAGGVLCPGVTLWPPARILRIAQVGVHHEGAEKDPQIEAVQVRVRASSSAVIREGCTTLIRILRLQDSQSVARVVDTVQSDWRRRLESYQIIYQLLGLLVENVELLLQLCGIIFCRVPHLARQILVFIGPESSNQCFDGKP